MKLSPLELKTLKVIRFAIGTEHAMSTEEIARKIFEGRSISCNSENRQREICTDFLGYTRTIIHILRRKMKFYIFSMSFEAEAIDIDPDSLTYKQKIKVYKKAYFIPIGKDFQETIDLIESAKKTLKKNIVGNRKTLRLLRELEKKAQTSDLTTIITEQQEKIARVLKEN